jgi:iduronate 2-sulfatase
LCDTQTLHHAIGTLQNLTKTKATDPRPFFVAVGFHKPHLPFVYPERFNNYYPIEDIQLPPNPFAPVDMPTIAWQGYGETRGYSDIAKLNASGKINTTLPDQVVKGLRRAYYAAVSYTDDNIGQLLSALDASGFAEDTVVAFWGDHGWHLGEHGEWDKHTNFDLNTHAPVMFKVPGPGGTAGGVRTMQPTETVDIFPTLVDFALGPGNRVRAVSGESTITHGKSSQPATNRHSHTTTARLHACTPPCTHTPQTCTRA